MLLEREGHLASLLQYAHEARAGHGRTVLVAGEAGVGKTSLLDALQDELTDAVWYSGICDGLFTPRPLAPLLDIAPQVGGELNALCESGAPRERLFSTLLRLLHTGGQLTVLAIEDVHWADEATLDLLRFLGRRLRDTTTVLVITYRDDGLAHDDPLRVAVGELTMRRATRRVNLATLSVDAVAVMADAADAADADPARLHALTGGNPFFVTEVLQTTQSALLESVLPESVRDAVLARVAGVSAQAHEVLDVAALIGARVDHELLSAAAGATMATIDELLACGVIVSDEQRLRFRHEITRMVIQSAIPQHRTAVAHQQILDALVAAAVDDDARLAFYAEGAGQDELALEFATRAARRASELAAHREAAAQFERALRASGGVGTRTVASLYDELASELSLIDRWQDSADARLEALRRWRDLGDALREGDSLRRLSRTMWRLCRGDDADQAAVDALKLLEPFGSNPELAWAYANLADNTMNRGEPAKAIPLARRAREVAEPLGLADVVSDALNTEACASAYRGDVWSGLLHRSLEVAMANGRHVQAGRAYANLYAQYVDELRIAEGEGIYVEGLAYCQEHDISTFSTCLRGERTSVLEKLGRWDEAEKLAGELLRQVGPSPVNRLNPLISMGKVLARRGLDGVWDSLDEATALADTLDEPTWTVKARLARAEAHWLEGRDDLATGELDQAAASAARGSTADRGWTSVWRWRITGASSPVDGLSGVGDPFAAELSGDIVRAARLWENRGLGYDAALALLGCDEATVLRDAVARLTALGASPAVALARQFMRRRGITSIPSGVRASTRKHPAGLTRREHEVLELVCEGLTNWQISARLFLSVKTVDHHVSAILGKLGVPSRKAAAEEASRRGLLGPATQALQPRYRTAQSG